MNKNYTKDYCHLVYVLLYVLIALFFGYIALSFTTHYMIGDCVVYLEELTLLRGDYFSNNFGALFGNGGNHMQLATEGGFAFIMYLFSLVNMESVFYVATLFTLLFIFLLSVLSVYLSKNRVNILAAFFSLFGIVCMRSLAYPIFSLSSCLRDSSSHFFGFLGLFLCCIGINKLGQKKYLILGGISLGLSCWCRLPGILFVIPAGVYTLGSLKKIGFKKVVYSLCLLSVGVSLGLLPLLGHNHIGSVSKSYSFADVNGVDYLGGFCGRSYHGSINQCYSQGSVAGTEYYGGFTGLDDSASIISCFWDKDSSGQSTSSGGIGKTTDEMHTQATFTGWDFVSIWGMDGYPVLQAFYVAMETYQDWLTDFSVPANKQGITNTPAGDDIQNLLKYAIGLNPMEACSTADLMEPVADDTNGVSIIYNKSKAAEDVQLFPIWSDKLVPSNWNADGFEFEKMSETDISETWQATHSVTGECGYIRLKAQTND
jgi:hypothetical protein